MTFIAADKTQWLKARPHCLQCSVLNRVERNIVACDIVERDNVALYSDFLSPQRSTCCSSVDTLATL
jgi:hypothetical protein